MKKKLVAIFALILVFSVSVLALAACEEEDESQRVIPDFELYHGERYLKEYTYYKTAVYVYNEERETYLPTSVDWDENGVYGDDALINFDYAYWYRDGRLQSEKWNGILLKGKEYVRALGETVTISMSDMSFDGTLEPMPVIFYDFRTGKAYLQLNLTDEEEESIFLKDFMGIYYNSPNERSDGSFMLKFWTKPTEIAGKKYQMHFWYRADLEPGDTDWSDSLNGGNVL